MRILSGQGVARLRNYGKQKQKQKQKFKNSKEIW
jgi:hypothetical protein